MRKLDMEVICPFCGAVLEEELEEELEPESNEVGGKAVYFCYRRICRNKEKHFGNGNIVVPYKKEKEKENENAI